MRHCIFNNIPFFINVNEINIKQYDEKALALVQTVVG